MSIEGYYDEVFAVPGLLEEIRKGEAAGCAAVIIACFDDTGLDAARTLVDTGTQSAYTSFRPLGHVVLWCSAFPDNKVPYR